MEGLPRMQWGLTTSLSPITDTPDSPPSAKHLLHTHFPSLLALHTPLTLPSQHLSTRVIFLAAKGVTLSFFPPLRGTAHPERITTCLFLLKNNPVNFRKQLRHSNGAKAHNNGGAVWRKQGGGQRVFFFFFNHQHGVKVLLSPKSFSGGMRTPTGRSRELHLWESAWGQQCTFAHCFNKQGAPRIFKDVAPRQ